MAGEDSSESFSDLQAQMRRSIDQIARSQLSNIHQVEIIRELLNGRRTVAELVEAIYRLRPTDPGYNTHYSRVRKEIRQIESKGLVSRALFGRDKPYRLTRLAVEKLATIGGAEERAPTLLSKLDVALFALVLGLGAAGLGADLWRIYTPTLVRPISFIFVFCGGAAFCRFVQMLRKVM